MGRRWTSSQRTKRYFRNRARQDFNRYWANATHPPAPNGKRSCQDCAYDATCTRTRGGNHMNCFQLKGSARASTPTSAVNGADSSTVGVIIFLLLIIWGLSKMVGG